MAITPKNWASFQHYKDRCPPWIKLHHNLLDNYEFHCLQVASKALAPCLWLLASEYEGGRITLPISAIAFRLHLSETELVDALIPLISGGFFVDDSATASTLLANRYQDAIPETETEAETERGDRANQGAAVASGTPLPTAAREAVAEKQQDKPARSLASALPSGALPREPDSKPAEPKVASSAPVNDRDPGNDYRSPPRTKSDNVLAPLPDKIAAKHKDES